MAHQFILLTIYSACSVKQKCYGREGKSVAVLIRG
jgi:hypothetical protein